MEARHRDRRPPQQPVWAAQLPARHPEIGVGALHAGQRGNTAQMTRGDRVAWERLEAERADERQMAELRWLNPDIVAEEAAAYAKYAAKKA